MIELSKKIIIFIITALCFFSIYWTHSYLFKTEQNTLIIASFGASGVLAFSEQKGTQSFIKMFTSSVIAAFLGVFFNQLDIAVILKITLAISTCILIINLFNINYPPAGAISIIPMISNSEIKALGYTFIAYPTLTGLIIIYSFSLLKNKINTTYYGK